MPDVSPSVVAVAGDTQGRPAPPSPPPPGGGVWTGLASYLGSARCRVGARSTQVRPAAHTLTLLAFGRYTGAGAAHPSAPPAGPRTHRVKRPSVRVQASVVTTREPVRVRRPVRANPPSRPVSHSLGPSLLPPFGLPSPAITPGGGGGGGALSGLVVRERSRPNAGGQLGRGGRVPLEQKGGGGGGGVRSF